MKTIKNLLIKAGIPAVVRWSADLWPPQQKGLLLRGMTAGRTYKHGSRCPRGWVAND
jgi:hypothetical protein